MASDAPLVGLIAPLKKSLFDCGTSFVPFLDLPICAIIKEHALQKSGLTLKIVKFKGLHLHKKSKRQYENLAFVISYENM